MFVCSKHPLSKSHRWLIRIIGVLVPRRLRAAWRQEWEAELRYREALLAGWDKLDWQNKLDLLRRSIGFWLWLIALVRCCCNQEGWRMRCLWMGNRENLIKGVLGFFEYSRRKPKCRCPHAETVPSTRPDDDG